MLSKKVCKRCWMKFFQREDLETLRHFMYDEGRILCPTRARRMIDARACQLNVGDEPPESCPFYLEHKLDAGQEGHGNDDEV